MSEHKPTPPYDYTRTERSRRRQAQLDVLAQAHGFRSWSALETACINGAYLTVYEDVKGLYEVTVKELE